MIHAGYSPVPGGNPSRVASGPVILEAPLRLAWQDPIGYFVSQLPLVADGVVVYWGKPSLRAHRESDHRRLWRKRLPAEDEPACIWNGRVIAWVENDHGSHLDLATGRELATFPGFLAYRAAVVRESLLVGGVVDAVRAYDLASGRQAWEWKVRPEQFGPGHDNNMLHMTPCADAERVYFGLRDGTIVALNLDDGSEAWRRVAFPESKHGVAETWGVAQLRNGVVFFRGYAYLGAFDARTGRRKWAREIPGLHDVCVYGHRAYALAGPEYVILELTRGKEIFRVDLRKQVPPRLYDRNETFRPITVSETHMFCGLGIGYVLAFERDTARLAWHHVPKPRASFHSEARMQIVGGRLYVGSMGVLMAFEPAPARAAQPRREPVPRRRVRK